jgi:hypothetical protein
MRARHQEAPRQMIPLERTDAFTLDSVAVAVLAIAFFSLLKRVENVSK